MSTVVVVALSFFDLFSELILINELNKMEIEIKKIQNGDMWGRSQEESGVRQR